MTVFPDVLALTLRDPWWLLLALLVPLALALRARGRVPAILFAPAALLRRRKRPDDEALGLPSTPEDRLPGSWRIALLPLPRALQVVALLLVVLALARPTRRTRLPDRTLGIDILLCLDVSSSMTSDDMDERRTRLEVAKDAAAAFIRGREDDRIGLVTFARYPDLRCPLTLDHDALSRILAEVETVAGDGPEDATGIGTAVARAAQVLEGSKGESKVVILLTDGEENVALAGEKEEIAPVHAAQLSQVLGTRVYTIVAGEGRRGPNGAWRKLDTRAARHIAKRTGGAFHQAQDAGAVRAVYDRIDELEKAPLEEPRFVWEDAYATLLLLALGLLLLGRLLGATVLDVLP